MDFFSGANIVIDSFGQCNWQPWVKYLSLKLR